MGSAHGFRIASQPRGTSEIAIATLQMLNGFIVFQRSSFPSINQCD